MFLFLFSLFAFTELYADSLDSKRKKLLKENTNIPFSKKEAFKPFPKIYKPEVVKWILFFSQNRSSYMRLWLKRSYRYFPLMESILQTKSLPKELVSMTLIESGLSSKAVSSAQAVGYWQFIKPTALRFDLRVNHWIDERQDFQKSTKAASEYLYVLYREFEDWLLVMAAYNMGESRLRKLITKYQTKNFWRLSKKPDFPRETALYVPKVLAAAYIVKKPENYGLEQFQVLAPFDYDIFYTPGGTDLKKMSLGAKISLKELKILNPDLKTNVLPQFISSHSLRIPEGSGRLISKWLDKQAQAN